MLSRALHIRLLRHRALARRVAGRSPALAAQRRFVPGTPVPLEPRLVPAGWKAEPLARFDEHAPAPPAASWSAPLPAPGGEAPTGAPSRTAPPTPPSTPAPEPAPAAPRYPPTVDELRETLLELRAQKARGSAEPARQQQPARASAPEAAAQVRPRALLGRRVEHLPGFNAGPRAAPPPPSAETTPPADGEPVLADGEPVLAAGEPARADELPAPAQPPRLDERPAGAEPAIAEGPPPAGGQKALPAESLLGSGSHVRSPDDEHLTTLGARGRSQEAADAAPAQPTTERRVAGEPDDPEDARAAVPTRGRAVAGGQRPPGDAPRTIAQGEPADPEAHDRAATLEAGTATRSQQESAGDARRHDGQSESPEREAQAAPPRGRRGESAPITPAPAGAGGRQRDDPEARGESDAAMDGRPMQLAAVGRASSHGSPSPAPAREEPEDAVHLEAAPAPHEPPDIPPPARPKQGAAAPTAASTSSPDHSTSAAEWVGARSSDGFLEAPPPGVRGQEAQSPQPGVGQPHSAHQTSGAAAPRAGEPPAARATASPPRFPGPARPSTPTPLREGTRRLLRPLVGIDPQDVPVHTGATAAAVAASYGAEAVSTGAGVFVGAGFGEDTPAGVGLIAHELLHSGRRTRRFIAPVGTDMAEERAAERAEQAAARFAQAPLDAAQQQMPRAYSAAAEPVRAVVRDARDETPARPPWGLLPAPWEPLALHPSPAPQAPPSEPATAAGRRAEDDGVVRAADPQRGLEAQQTGATATTSAAQLDDLTSPETDIEALAHEVYARIRRRLAAERRRSAT